MANNKVKQEEKRWKYDIFQSLTGCVLIVLTFVQLWNMDTTRVFLPVILLLGSGFTAIGALRANAEKRGILTLILGILTALLLAVAVIGALSLLGGRR